MVKALTIFEFEVVIHHFKTVVVYHGVGVRIVWILIDNTQDTNNGSY